MKGVVTGVFEMQLKTPSGRVIDPEAIDYMLMGRMAPVQGMTLVQLKTGEEVLLENSHEEIVEEMNNSTIGALKRRWLCPRSS